MNQPVVQYRVVCRRGNSDCRVIGVNELVRPGKRLARCFIEEVHYPNRSSYAGRRACEQLANTLNALNNLPLITPKNRKRKSDTPR